MKIIDKLWFTSTLGTMGIIVGEDEVTGERKAYVGIGYGVSEDHDLGMVKSWGTRLHLATLEHLVKLLRKDGD